MVGWPASCGVVDGLVWHTSSNIGGPCCSCSKSIGMFKCLLASDTVESSLGASRYPHVQRANATIPLVSPTLIMDLLQKARYSLLETWNISI